MIFRRGNLCACIPTSLLWDIVQAVFIIPILLCIHPYIIYYFYDIPLHYLVFTWFIEFIFIECLFLIKRKSIVIYILQACAFALLSTLILNYIWAKYAHVWIWYMAANVPCFLILPLFI